MNKYLSQKLKVLSFISIIMVVFLHSYNVLVTSENGISVIEKGYSTFIQDFISQGLVRVAVPLFFIISGYLFFLNMTGTNEEFAVKIRKRFRTVLLPYLFWSLWAILIFLILQSLPQFKSFFANDLIRTYSLSKLLYTFFISPLNYQLWFLRDLFLMTLLSPLIFLALKRLKLFAVIMVFIPWMINFDFIVFTNITLFFFVFGAYLSLYSRNILTINLSAKVTVFSAFLWICLVLSATLLIHFGIISSLKLMFVYNISILAGVLTIWALYDNLLKGRDITGTRLFQLALYSFFIYAFHEPVLTILKKGLFFVVGRSQGASVLVFFLAPVIAISLSILVGFALKKIVPRFYGLITGGR